MHTYVMFPRLSSLLEASDKDILDISFRRGRSDRHCYQLSYVNNSKAKVFQ